MAAALASLVNSSQPAFLVRDLIWLWIRVRQLLPIRTNSAWREGSAGCWRFRIIVSGFTDEPQTSPGNRSNENICLRYRSGGRERAGGLLIPPSWEDVYQAYYICCQHEL